MVNKRDINPHARHTTLKEKKKEKKKKPPTSFEMKVSTATKSS